MTITPFLRTWQSWFCDTIRTVEPWWLNMPQRKRIVAIVVTGSFLIGLELLGLISLNRGLGRIVGGLGILFERANAVLAILQMLHP
jgi:hypothetical protein